MKQAMVFPRWMVVVISSSAIMLGSALITNEANAYVKRVNDVHRYNHRDVVVVGPRHVNGRVVVNHNTSSWSRYRTERTVVRTGTRERDTRYGVVHRGAYYRR